MRTDPKQVQDCFSKAFPNSSHHLHSKQVKVLRIELLQFFQCPSKKPNDSGPSVKVLCLPQHGQHEHSGWDPMCIHPFTWIVVGSLFLSSRRQLCKDLDSSLPTACKIAWYIKVNKVTAAVVHEFWQHWNSFTASNHSISKYINRFQGTSWLTFHFLAGLQSLFITLALINVFSGLARLGDPSVPDRLSKILESLDASAYWLRYK